MNQMKRLPPELEMLSGAHSYTHGFLPLAAAYCRQLGASVEAHDFNDTNLFRPF